MAEPADENAHPMYRMPSAEEQEEADRSCCCKCGSSRPQDQMQKPSHPDPTRIKRKCTDIFCLLLIIVCWAAMTALGIYAMEDGNPQALISPTDYKGRICGVDSGVANKPYGYYIDKSLDKVCLEKCPSKTKNITGHESAYDSMICMDDEVSDVYKNADPANTTYYYGYDALFNEGHGPCNFQFKSYTVLYYCILDPNEKIPNIGVSGVSLSDDMTGKSITSIITASDDDMSSDVFMEFIQDVVTTRNYIFGFGFAVAFLMSFFYSWLMTKGLIHILVWTCILITEAMFLGLGGLMYETGTDWEDEGHHSDYEVNGMKVLGIVFLSFAAIFLCFIACSCSKIRKCCDLVQTAGQAVRDIPVTVFFPIIQTAGLVVFLVPWMYYSAYVNSQGHYSETHSENSTYTNEVWEWDDNSKFHTEYANTFLVFSYFWTSQFITAMGQLIMALTFVQWYFTEDPPVDKNAEKKSCCYTCIFGKPHAYRGNGLFFTGIKIGLFYHAGTAAAGSLIIAIIKTIRYLISKVQYYCKQSTTGVAKKIADVVICCIQCCLYCVEKCMKFINRHAYIITAIKCLPFCSAAVDAFWLIARNIALIASMTLIQEFVMIIGKLCIITCTGALSYYVMNSVFDSTQVNSFIGPVLFVMALAYFIADMFMVTYSMAIDTILHCYIADKEMYKGESAGPYCTRPGCPHLAKIDELIQSKKESAASDVEQTSKNPIN